MTGKTPLEKLAVLVPHWIEHTRVHIEELSEWQAAAKSADPEATRHFAAAIDALRAAAEALDEVATRLPRHEHHEH